MKVARLSRRGGGGPTYGLVDGGAVATREEIGRAAGADMPESASEFMFGGWLDRIREAAGRGLPHEDLSRFDLLPPVERPGKILCLAFNYADHAGEQGKEPPDEPVVVMKPRTALRGHGADVALPPFVEELDYEAELAVVIGRDCPAGGPESTDAARAGEAVFGYTVLNDVTARDVQRRDGQFTRAKGMDTFAPCGPWITTADEIPDPARLGIALRVNGELRQDSSTAMMRLKPPDIVSHLCRSMTLERGDVISTGTPAGVVLNNGSGWGYLRDGDVVEAEIEGIGTLRSTVRSRR